MGAPRRASGASDTHESLGTIYAYPSEIEAWLRARSAGDGTPHPDKSLRLSGPRWILIGALILLVGLAASWIARLPFSNRGDPVQVLIKPFDNRTDQPRFDDLVEDTLRRELGGADRFALVSADRIRNTLSLMRQPADAVLDARTAREIARRDGNIHVLLAGGLERFGSSYRVTVELIDPVEGAVLETVSEDAPEESELPSALKSISKAAGAALEDLDPWSEDLRPALELVTTSSLEALDLYSQAMALMLEGAWNMEAAGQILHRAVAGDPEFASAYIQLAYAMEAQGKPASEFMPFAERALELLPTTSERERHFIEGSYLKLRGDLQAALPHFVTLTALYPDHYWGFRRLAEVERATGNVRGAAFDMARAADLRPDSIPANGDAFDFILETGQFWTTNRVVERLRRLFAGQNGGVHPILQVEFFEAGRHLMNGDAEAALREAERLRNKLDAIPPDSWTRRSGYAARLAELYIALGQLHVAEELLELIRSDDVDELRNTAQSRRVNETRLVASLALSRDGDCCIETVLRDGPAALQWRILMVRAGQTPSPAGGNRILQGELARAQGDREAAMELLMTALAEARGRPRPYQPYVFLGAEALAGLLADAGDMTEAIQLLEEWSGEFAKSGAFMFPPTSAPYWVRVRWKLAEFYREAGREQDASAIESYLQRLFAVADDDHFFPMTRPQ